ncbi:SGS-domain-containing protein [Coniochaeta sp. PMI_546]|nr:SGS-domain-containing protein [Coniochaeta sp. PMI_546]
MSTHGQKGIEALKARNYAEALVHLDRALESSPSPTWLLARAQANQQLQRYSDALRDAELAYHTAAERGSGNSRKQMIDAQYRRAVVLFKMGRYADADCCAKWSQLLCEGRPAREDDGVEKQVDDQGYYTVTLEQAKADTAGQPKQGNPGDGAVAQALSSSTATSQDWNRAYVWRCQALGKMESLPRDDPGRKVGVTKVPQRPAAEKKKADNITRSGGTAAQTPVVSSDKDRSEAPPKPVPEPGSVPDDKLKARADFYQTGQTVTVSFFVKGVDKEALKPTFHNNYVVLAPLPREAAPYVKPGDRESYSTLYLGGQIVPGASRYTVSPRKIELVLQKAVPGQKWATWGTEVIGQPTDGTEGQTGAAAEPSTPAIPDISAQHKAVSASSPSNAPKVSTDSQPAPAYPTSSKTGPKNWDKVVDGEVADADDDKDVNFFFKQLYKNATPEQQRAMMKSFTESNGTALSTDWNDVSKRTVETVPPEGVEAKKWD